MFRTGGCCLRKITKHSIHRELFPNSHEDPAAGKGRWHQHLHTNKQTVTLWFKYLLSHVIHRAETPTCFLSVWLCFSDSAVLCAGQVDSRDHEADYSCESYSQQIPEFLRFPTDSEEMAAKAFCGKEASSSALHHCCLTNNKADAKLILTIIFISDSKYWFGTSQLGKGETNAVLSQNYFNSVNLLVL